MVEENKNSYTTTTPNDEIDLIDVFNKIWMGRKTIYKSVAVCLFLGLIIILGSPKEYKSEVTLLVEAGSGTNGMSGLLQQFGGLAGINLSGAGASTDALRPDLYPDVIKSTPFLLEVLNQKITESKYDSTLTVSQYLERHTRPSVIGVVLAYTFGLPGKIFVAIRGEKNQNPKVNSLQKMPLKLSLEQASRIDALIKRIKTTEGESSNTLVISVEMQDPLVAAQLTDSVVKSLTRYITDYRIQKAKTDLEFVAKSHAEAEIKYKQAQQTLAAYTDQNKNLIMASARTTEQRLQSEYTLAFNIFNTLSQQLEQAKFKVQQETPVFKVLNPAQVPLKKSRPNSIIILLLTLFLGCLGSVIILFGIPLINSVMEKKIRK